MTVVALFPALFLRTGLGTGLNWSGNAYQPAGAGAMVCRLGCYEIKIILTLNVLMVELNSDLLGWANDRTPTQPFSSPHTRWPGDVGQSCGADRASVWAGNGALSDLPHPHSHTPSTVGHRAALGGDTGGERGQLHNVM